MLWASHAQQIWCGRYKTNSNSRSIIKREVQRQKNVTPSPAPPPPPPPPPQESNSFAAAAATVALHASAHTTNARFGRSPPAAAPEVRVARTLPLPATRYPQKTRWQQRVSRASLLFSPWLLAIAFALLSRRWTRPLVPPEVQRELLLQVPLLSRRYPVRSS